MALLEVCVETAGGLAAAVRGGADRIELCQALGHGGLTPSAGLMAAAVRAGRPVHILIRPRAGDFQFDASERAIQCDDIQSVRATGLDGVVLGALDATSGLDLPVLTRLAKASDGLSLTLNRAFDLVPDQDLALEQAIDLGFARILTSGRAPTAEAGIDTIARLIERARDRIVILPGGGITAANAALFLAVGARELHASCSRPLTSNPGHRALGLAPDSLRVTDAGLVRALKAAAA